MRYRSSPVKVILLKLLDLLYSGITQYANLEEDLQHPGCTFSSILAPDMDAEHQEVLHQPPVSINLKMEKEIYHFFRTQENSENQSVNLILFALFVPMGRLLMDSCT